MSEHARESTPAGTAPPEPGCNLLTGQLGDFELGELLARGGFGAVYRARQLRLARDVVIKVGEVGVRGNASLRREIDLVRRLRHPNIVHLYDVGETTAGQFWLAMELVDGETLAARLRRSGPLPARRAREVLLQLLDALTEAHGLGIVHRDLKPDNVMLTRKGARADVVKLLDFGIAELLDGGHEHGTAPADAPSLVGTPRYMAPEALDGLVGACNDVYAAGLIGIEMLSGAPAVAGDGPAELLARHLQGALELPRWLAGTSLGAVLEHAVARDPAQRFAHARLFYDALASLSVDELDQLESEATPTRDLRPHAAELAEVAERPAIRPAAARRSRATIDVDALGIHPAELDAPAPPPDASRPTPRARAWILVALGVLAAGALLRGLVALGQDGVEAVTATAARDEVFNEASAEARPAAPARTPPQPALTTPTDPAPPLPDLALLGEALVRAAVVDASNGAVRAREVVWILRATPARSTVTLDGKQLCRRTPCTLRLPRGSGTRAVTLERLGRRPATVLLERERGGERDVALERLEHGFGLIRLP